MADIWPSTGCRLRGYWTGAGGFFWLGLDETLSPAVTHGMGAAFVLYAQGLLPLIQLLRDFVMCYSARLTIE